jgi:hypothetical protein
METSTSHEGALGFSKEQFAMKIKSEGMSSQARLALEPFPALVSGFVAEFIRVS